MTNRTTLPSTGSGPQRSRNSLGMAALMAGMAAGFAFLLALYQFVAK